MNAIATVVSADDELPAELEAELAALELLTDDELWQAARTRLSATELATLEELHFKQQSVGLTDLEKATEAQLVRAYERAILVRAEAAVLLKQRGYDISVLPEKPHE